MVNIAYWSGTGNTDAMAQEIVTAAKAAGADVTCERMEDTTPEQVAKGDVILLGCPAMGAEELEDSVVEPFFTCLSPLLKGKKSRSLRFLWLGFRRMDGYMEKTYRRRWCDGHRHSDRQ